MKILIVSHDAGGAQLLSAWVKRHTENEYAYLLEGPASGIFLEKLALDKCIARTEMHDLLDALNFDLIITSTSWNSDLERMTIQAAKHKGLKVISMLDHWSEYSSRFRIGKESIFPDEIWVTDKFAFELASMEFPNIPIHLIPNLYFEEIKEAFFRVGQLSGRLEEGDRGAKKVLFITEPISAFSRCLYGSDDYYHENEFDLLSRFLNHILDDKKTPYTIRLRPHPSEEPNKYSDVLSHFGKKLDINLSIESSIIEDCVWANWVVGFDSMGLVIGLLGGKKVSSCLPQNSKFKTLPFDEIEIIFQLN